MIPVIEIYKEYELHTTPNLDAFTTITIKNGESLGGSFSTPHDKYTSIQKAKMKIDAGLYEIENRIKRMEFAGELSKSFLKK